MSRAAKIEQAAREVQASADALDARGNSPDVGPEVMRGQMAMMALAAALALPADPVSVDERERALAERMWGAGYDAARGDGGFWDDRYDEVIAAVNATHPRAPSAEYERGREDAARVCEAAAGYCAARRLYIDGPSEDDAENGIRADVAFDLLENVLATLTPVAQVAPSERDYAMRVAMLARAEPELPIESVVFQAGLPDRVIAPSAPRDQGGALREWVHRAMSAAWDIGYDAKHGDGVLAGETERARESDLAFLLGPAGDLGPPPTDGVTAAYERAVAIIDDVIKAEGSWVTARAVAEMRNRIRALAAPVSEKERAK